MEKEADFASSLAVFVSTYQTATGPIQPRSIRKFGGRPGDAFVVFSPSSGCPRSKRARNRFAADSRFVRPSFVLCSSAGERRSKQTRTRAGAPQRGPGRQWPLGSGRVPYGAAVVNNRLEADSCYPAETGGTAAAKAAGVNGKWAGGGASVPSVSHLAGAKATPATAQSNRSPGRVLFPTIGHWY